MGGREEATDDAYIKKQSQLPTADLWSSPSSPSEEAAPICWPAAGHVFSFLRLEASAMPQSSHRLLAAGFVTEPLACPWPSDNL